MIIWGRVNIHRKAENSIYNVSIESLLRFYMCFGQKFRFLRLLKSAQSKIPAVRPEFKIAELLDYLSYKGVQITVRKLRKLSSIGVFNSSSDFPQNSLRFVVLVCWSQSSQIWRRCQKNLYGSFLDRLEDAHLRIGQPAWYGLCQKPFFVGVVDLFKYVDDCAKRCYM
jgi:hypothetical protein